MSPYRIAPARAPRRKRSTLRRLHDIGRRCVAAGYRPPFIVFALWLFLRPIGLVAFGLWRLRRARKTIRLWSTRCDHRGDGCHTCGGTATTFPSIAAYREATRTGDLEAFAAKRLDPVTVCLCALAEAKRAQDNAAMVAEMLRERRGPWSKVAATEHVDAMNGKRGRTG